jgi:UPF0716 protein FxsA
MRLAILLAVIAYPFLEIALLIKAGRVAGVLGVLAIIVLTAAAGTAAIRRHGFSLAARMAEALERGEEPEGPGLDAALVVLAGVFLVAPGLLTDAVGAILLVPPFRTWVARSIRARAFDFRRASRDSAGHSGNMVIEGEFQRIGEEEISPRGNERHSGRV